MRSTELELHELLDDVAASCYNLDEQARIIAEASAIMAQNERLASRGKSSPKDAERLRTARMLDALMQAMGHLASYTADDSDFEEDAPVYIDGRGLDPREIIHQASMLPDRHTYAMELLNEDDLDMFLRDDEEEDDGGEYEISDGMDNHPSSLYHTPGRGTHRSDSLNRM